MIINETVRKLMSSPLLKESVTNATTNLREGRLKAIAQMPDYQKLRSRGENIRERTIEDLDAHVTTLMHRFEENGGKTYFAKDDSAVIRKVIEIAAEHNAKLAVKSKSMVSEEIHLNHHLKEHGMEVVETDLGEFIIQLANDPPSHIVMPSLHKNREDIRALFAEHLQYDSDDQPEQLVNFARKLLREKFLYADIGITGCNFGVAETGSIVLLTNEGNGRFCTSLPKVQITIMGMERVVPTLEELDPLLTLLTIGATGQKSTSYISFINGPKSDDDVDGPEEVYLIIVDNNRSSVLNTRMSKALHCIRCGACSNVCPVFKQVGGHAYNSPYSGPIGAVISPLILGMERHAEVSYASSLCGACDEACPVNIPLHELLIENRKSAVEAGKLGIGERLGFKLWSYIFTSPKLYATLRKMAYLGSNLFGSEWLLQKLGSPLLRGWTDTRALPKIARRSFLELYHKAYSTRSSDRR